MDDRGLRMRSGSVRSYGGLLLDIAPALDRPPELEDSPHSGRGWLIALAVTGALCAEVALVQAFLPGSHRHVMSVLLLSMLSYLVGKAVDALLWVRRPRPSQAVSSTPVGHTWLPQAVGVMFLQGYLIVALVTRDDGAWWWLAVAFASILLVRAAMERGWFVRRATVR